MGVRIARMGVDSRVQLTMMEHLVLNHREHSELGEGIMTKPKCPMTNRYKCAYALVIWIWTLVILRALCGSIQFGLKSNNYYFSKICH